MSIYGFVKHENKYSCQKDAWSQAKDSLEDATTLIDVATSDEKMSIEERAECCALAILDIQAALRFLGYVSSAEKNANLIIEQYRREREVTDGNASNMPA